MVYFGETGRDLERRIKEHKDDIVLCKPASAVANHVWETNGHQFDFPNAKVIFKSNYTLRRHIVESALITKYKHSCVNLNYGFNPTNKVLSNFITSLVDIT